MDKNTLASFFDKLLKTQESSAGVEGMIEQAKKMFEEFSQILAHASPAEREQIDQTLKGISEKINTEVDKVCQEKGISREDLNKMLSDPSHYVKKDFEAVEKFREEIQKKPTFSEEKKKNVSKAKSRQNWISA